MTITCHHHLRPLIMGKYTRTHSLTIAHHTPSRRHLPPILSWPYPHTSHTLSPSPSTPHTHSHHQDARGGARPSTAPSTSLHPHLDSHSLDDIDVLTSLSYQSNPSQSNLGHSNLTGVDNNGGGVCLNILHKLALDGVFAVLNSIAVKCSHLHHNHPHHNNNNNNGSSSNFNNSSSSGNNNRTSEYSQNHALPGHFHPPTATMLRPGGELYQGTTPLAPPSPISTPRGGRLLPSQSDASSSSSSPSPNLSYVNGEGGNNLNSKGSYSSSYHHLRNHDYPPLSHPHHHHHHHHHHHLFIIIIILPMIMLIISSSLHHPHFPRDDPVDPPFPPPFPCSGGCVGGSMVL